MMYENGVLSNYRRSWFLYRLVLNVILLGCFLLNFEGAEGQVQVSILNDTLDFFGDRSELNVFIDSTLTFRVIWRNSSWDEPNRPTDPSSILIQNLNGAVTCPVTGDCGRFDMNSEYGLVLNGVIIEDGNQTLWCDVSAGDGNGFDSIVPVVAGWRNHDSDSSVTYDLNNNMLHCTVYNFLPDDNFTLTWMDPEGEVLVSTTKASIYEDIYFSATLSAEPSKSGKKYTCVAEGKAFTFDAFSKEIYVPGPISDCCPCRVANIVMLVLCVVFILIMVGVWIYWGVKEDEARGNSLTIFLVVIILVALVVIGTAITLGICFGKRDYTGKCCSSYKTLLNAVLGILIVKILLASGFSIYWVVKIKDEK